MENTKNWDGLQYGANPEEWQTSENANQWSENDQQTSEPHSAFGDDSMDDVESLYATTDSGRDDDDDDNDDDDDDNDDDDDSEDDANEEESGNSDWGNIDPQSSPFPSSNDPSVPGSAV